MERVQTKISEERILKIIQEVSLANVHEFDNRGGKSHITGVYRWVDKKMKNQIYNYGKRTMFEFMIHEPAKLHRIAIAKQDTLVAPVDPRKAPAPHTMANANQATPELLDYWAGVYGVSLKPLPENKQLLHTVNERPNMQSSFPNITSTFEIEENYVAQSAKMVYHFTREKRSWACKIFCTGFKNDTLDLGFDSASRSGTLFINGMSLVAQNEFWFNGRNIENATFNITFYCVPSDAYKQTWRTEAYEAVIAAYKEAYNAYKEEKASIEAAQKAKAAEEQEVISQFYRIIENDVLKHNCIAYLLQDYLTTLGQDFTQGDTMEHFSVTLNSNLDHYTALAKFMEQAFEWEIMDYTFYPYYWADRTMWQDMYLTENTDPLFRSFLQAGMARVVVTVKPGFEDAVQYFMSTGKVWLGGEAPVIGDELYLSIAQEMQEPTGIPQGNYWITRIPTTLTIIQDKSTGLASNQPLPIFPENEPEKCENPEELETKSVFTAEEKVIEGSEKASTLPRELTTILNKK